MKKIVYSCLFTLFIGVGFAGFSNTFEMNRVGAGGDTLEYGCLENYDVDIVYGGLDDYNGFNFYLEFDPNDVDLTHNSYNSAIFSTNGDTGFVLANSYYVGMASPVMQVTDNWASRFNITPKINIGYTGTFLEFVDLNGNAPVQNVSTSDKINIYNGSVDTLSGVINKTLTFEEYPCEPDNISPKMYDYKLDNGNSAIVYDVVGSNVLSNTRVIGTGHFNLLVLDWDKSRVSYVPFWYNGNPSLILNNYVTAPSSVDTEYGVDESSLSVTINNQNPLGQTSVVIPNGSLTTTTYTGYLQPSRYTWNSEDRGYWVEFENATNNPFEVEKPVTITINGWDNPHRDGTTGSMVGQTFTLNSSTPPVMTGIYPIDNTSDMNPNITQIEFRVTDAWAGVDTGKIWITIPGVSNGSGDSIPSYTYSSTSMIFSGINGTPGNGNSGGYDVTLTLDSTQTPFPADVTINFTGTVVDYAGHTGYINDWNISTRKPCRYFGCNEILDIYIMEGINNNSGIPYPFTGSLLIATGTNPNSPYPYITGTSGDTLMCGFEWTGAILSGNVDVLNSVGASIKGDIYNLNELYITGLDFVYDPNTGIIDIQ